MTTSGSSLTSAVPFQEQAKMLPEFPFVIQPPRTFALPSLVTTSLHRGMSFVRLGAL